MFKSMRSLIFVACACALFVGCEDDSSPSTASDNDSFLFHVDSEYAQYNTGAGAGSSFANVITAAGHNLYTANSAVIVQRESCSGFTAGSLSDAALGWNLRFYYNMDETDFSQSPTRYYPTEIYLWPSTCEDPFGETTPSTNTCTNPCNSGCTSGCGGSCTSGSSCQN